MTATGEPTRISGGRGPVVSLEEAISAATAELGLLLAEKTWVQSAELQVRTARSQDAQIQRVQLHDPQPDGVQPDGVQPDDVQPVGAQPGGVQPGGVQLHDVQPGNAQIHAVQLYNWQRRALADWRTAGRRGVVQAVTGAGKTRVGVAAVAEALAEGRRAVVIAPTRVLVGQWCAVLEQQLPGVALSQTLGDTRPWQVLVSTVQSAMRRPAVPFGERALLVVDECHRCGAEGFSQALRLGFDWRLGLTATLERGDDGDETLHSYFGGVVHEVGYREALADELISPFRFAQVSVPLLPAERATYEELTEALRSARDRLIITHELPSEPIGAFLNAVSLLAQDRSRDGGGALARLYMAKFSARRTLLADTPVKMVALNQLSTAVDESNGTIVFTQTKEASLQAARVLSDAGCVSAAIHGELDEEAREERLELFRSGAISSITAPRVLDEGVDVPEADLGIVTAANRSRRQMV